MSSQLPNNKYFDYLNTAIGKKVIVKDVTKDKYEGILMGFSAQHLNVLLKLESGNYMVLRNIVAFEIIEKEGGSVVSFMGDAFLSVLDNIESTYRASVGIAKCLDRQCEYLSVHQKDYPGDWNYIKGGPSLKIGIEYGWIDISTINSELLGQQRLLIGPAINYACRITAAGKGNRCHVGPQAMKKGMGQWWNDGPFSVKGKKHEGQYEYWSMNLGDIWREGKNRKGEDTYWG